MYRYLKKLLELEILKEKFKYSALEIVHRFYL